MDFEKSFVDKIKFVDEGQLFFIRFPYWPLLYFCKKNSNFSYHFQVKMITSAAFENCNEYWKSAVEVFLDFETFHHMMFHCSLQQMFLNASEKEMKQIFNNHCKDMKIIKKEKIQNKEL